MPKKECIKKQISKKEKKHKKSELEEEINETKESESQETNEVLEKTSEEIIDNQFHEFMKPLTESFSPVLEKIEVPQQESLEKDLGSAPITQEKKDEKQTKYAETNYEDTRMPPIQNENFLIKQPALTNMEATRINLNPQIEQNFQINPELQESRRQSQGDLEKDYVAKVGGFKQTKTHSPIEQQEKKYEIEKII